MPKTRRWIGRRLGCPQNKPAGIKFFKIGGIEKNHGRDNSVQEKLPNMSLNQPKYSRIFV
jgi:hypothetical protein